MEEKIIKTKQGKVMSLTPYEQETQVLFSKDDELAVLDTCSQRIANRFIREGHEPWVIEKYDNCTCWRFKIPVKDLKIAPVRHKPVTY